MRTGYRAILLVLIIAAGIIGFVSLLSLAFPPRTPLTAEEFTAHMEEAGFTVEDERGQQLEADPDWADTELGRRLESVLAVRTDYFLIQFIMFSTETYAQVMYGNMRREVESLRAGGMSSTTEINLSNFSRFTQTASGQYIVISRIEHTLVFAHTGAENRSTINDLLELLGDY